MYTEQMIYHLGFIIILLLMIIIAFACYKAGKYDERAEWINRLNRGEIEVTQRNIRKPRRLRSRRV